MKRTYIPHGADAQGRRKTGVWLPRRCDGTPEAAHAATPLLSDDTDAWEPMTWQETLRFFAPGVVAVAAVLALAFFGWR